MVATRYHGTLEEQLTDGCSCPKKDCVACCGVMLAKIASAGRWDLSPCAVRRKAGVSCWTGTGGLTYEKMAYGVRELTLGEVRITVYYRRTREQVRDLLAEAPLAESIKYSVLLGTRYACDDDFRDGHGVVLADYRQVNDDPDLVDLGDPLADGRGSYRQGWIWAPANLLFRAGEARSAQFGSAGITVAVTNPVENVIRRARVNARLRSAPRTDAPAVGRLEEDHFYLCLGTASGGEWINDLTGRPARGWWKVRLNSGVVGWARGEVMVRV